MDRFHKISELIKEDIYEIALGIAGYGIWHYDPMIDRLILDSRFYEILGYDDNDPHFNNYDLFEDIHPEDIPNMQLALANRANIDNNPILEFRVKNKSGNYIWLRSKSLVISADPVGNITSLIGVASNITKYKLEDLGKEAAADKLARFSELLPGAIYIFKIDVEGKFSFPYASESILELYGFSSYQILDDSLIFDNAERTITNTIIPEFVDEFNRTIVVSMNELSVWDHEFKIMHPTKGERWLRAISKPIRLQNGDTLWYGYTEDITEKKANIQKLLEANYFLKATSEIALIGGWSYDVEKNENYWTEYTYTIHEVESGFIPHPSKGVLFYKEGESRDKIIKVFNEGVSKGKTFDENFQFITANGKEKWVRSKGIPHIKDGKVVRIDGIIQDITKQKQIEMEFVKAKEEAEAANLAKSQFLANMSHEIRTPMNAILGFLEILQTTNLNQEQKDYIEEIKGASDSLLSTISDVLDLSKIESGKYDLINEDFELHNTLQNIVNSFTFAAKVKGLDISLELSEDVPNIVRGDYIKIRQILNNLINNAIKFTNEGSILLKVSTLMNLQDDITIRFDVIDTGIGIDPAKYDLLFQPFSQLDDSNTRRYGGSGLGLTISKNLATLMKGSLGVSSNEFGGSTFSLQLNLKVINSEFKTQSSSKIKSPDYPVIAEISSFVLERNPKILIAEDNEINSRLMKKLLQSMKLDCDTARNGKEALEMCIAQQYDLIFMDWQMPLIDGLETTKFLRQLDQYNNVPIIGITASVMKGDREMCLAAGMDSYITKPIMKAQVIEVINVFIDADRDKKVNLYIQTLSRLQSELELDEANSKEILDSAIESIAELLDKSKEYIANGEIEELYKCFHQIKGVASNVRMNDLAAYIKELENNVNDDVKTNNIDTLYELFVQYQIEN